MKAFKILELDIESRPIGFVVAENIQEAYATWEKHCLEMDQEEEFEKKELEEISREDFNNTSWVDETAEPDEDGEYPTVQSNYDEEVLNVTEPYVIEFER